MISLISVSDKIQNKQIRSKVKEFLSSIPSNADNGVTKCYNICINFCKAYKLDILYYCEGYIIDTLGHAWIKYDSYNIDLKSIWLNEYADNSSKAMVGRPKEINTELPIIEIKSTSTEFDEIYNYFKTHNYTISKDGIMGLQKEHKISVFSVSNYTLKKYVIKLLNYNQPNSESYKKVFDKLKGIDDYILDLVGGNERYHNSKGLERTNYINELLADIRYHGHDALKHISYVARTLKYEHNLENMNTEDLKVFTQLRDICSKEGNNITRKLFNQLVRSFSLKKVDFNDIKVGDILSEDGGHENTGEVTNIDYKTRSVTILPKEATKEIVVKYSTNDSDNDVYRVCSDCGCGGASLSTAGVADGGVDLNGKPLNQAEIDDKVHEASRVTFSTQIKSLDDYKSWIHNYMQQAHGENYDEDLTEKVANDLNKKYNGDFGAMIGAAKSFIHK